MNKTLAALNIVMLLILSGSVIRLFIDKASRSDVTGTIRAERLEIVDQQGNTTFSVGEKRLGAYPSEMAFYDSTGRPAILVLVDKKGHGTMFFQSKQTEGKVAVGFLNGNDAATAPNEQQDAYGWGLQVRANDGHSLFSGLSSLDQPLQ